MSGKITKNLGRSSGIVASAGGSNDIRFFTRQESPQAISNASETTLVYDTEDFDIGGGYNTSDGLYTCPAGAGGLYYMYWQSKFGTGAGGSNYRSIVYRDPEGGGSFAEVNRSTGYTGQSQNIAQAGFWITLTAGDILKITVYHTQSSTQNMYDNDYTTYWGGFKLII